MLSANELKNDYINWYKNNLHYKSLSDNLVRIDNPFKDSSMDDIIIYAEKNPNDSFITLTDDGYTMFNLRIAGVDINRSKKRQFIFKKNLESYGISYNNKTEELYVKFPIEKFSENKHRLLQCLLFVNDMYILSKNNVKSIFTEDVSEVFDENNIIYSQDIIINGKSGMTHKFEFLIPGMKNKKEKFVKAVSAPNNTTSTKAFVTDVNQAKAVKREKPNEFFFILDNRKKPVNVEVYNLLVESGITPINFTELTNNIDQLSNIS